MTVGNVLRVLDTTGELPKIETLWAEQVDELGVEAWGCTLRGGSAEKQQRAQQQHIYSLVALN